MFSLNPNTRVFLRPGVTDMRMGFNSLFGLVEQVLGKDPTSGHLFVLCNRSRNRLKVLFWDGSGLWVCAKRLESGHYIRSSLPSFPLLGVLLKIFLRRFSISSESSNGSKLWYRSLSSFRAVLLRTPGFISRSYAVAAGS